jgi:predicted alpha/beta-hydrolase family hydrolase
MSSQLLSKGSISAVRALVFYGFPLHPVNNPGIDRAEHLSEVKVPMLFLQGTKDSLADLTLINKVVSTLPLASIEIIENADHSFKVGKKDSIVDLSKKTQNWLRHQMIL